MIEQEIASAWSVVEKGGFAAFAVVLLVLMARFVSRMLNSTEKLHERLGDVQERNAASLEKLASEQQKLSSGHYEIRQDLSGICKFDPALHCANFSRKGS